MSTAPADREALAASILADARARAAKVAHPGARASMLLAAERRAARAREGDLPGQAKPKKRTWPSVASDPDDPPRQTKRRPCLRCTRPFDSEGPGNRMCEPCRRAW